MMSPDEVWLKSRTKTSATLDVAGKVKASLSSPTHISRGIPRLLH